MTTKRISKNEKKVDTNDALIGELIFLGMPLSSANDIPSQKQKTKQLLSSTILRYIDLPNKKNAREKEAFSAFLLAISRQYPTFFKTLLAKNNLVFDFLPRQITGRIIKLKRIAEARISTYL